jgi:hypothetical protein
MHNEQRDVVFRPVSLYERLANGLYHIEFFHFSLSHTGAYIIKRPQAGSGSKNALLNIDRSRRDTMIVQ